MMFLATRKILLRTCKIEEINLPLSVEQNDSRVAYFRQAQNGLYIRMALLDSLLNS